MYKFCPIKKLIDSMISKCLPTKKGKIMGVKSLPQPHSVKLNFIMNAILKMSAFIFPLITFPYVSRIFGAAGNGKVSFAVSVIGYFSMLAQLGIPTYGVKVCAACRNNERKLNQTVQELLIINSITVLVSYVALFICMMMIPRLQADRTLMLIISSSILLNAIGMDWLFEALEQFSYITIRNLGFKILSILLMFAFVHNPEDYVIYGAISIVGTCGSNICNLIYARRFLDRRPIGNYNLKQHIKPILSFFMLSASISVYTNMDSIMLGFLSSDAQVGYYAAATKMKSILVSSITALGGVLLPRMSNYIAQGKTNDFYEMIKKSVNFILIASLPITIYFSFMANTTIGILAGDKYLPAIIPMKIISLTVVLIGFSNIIGIQVFVPTNREKNTIKSTFAGAFANLIVNAACIPTLGASGAAIGTVVAEATVLFVQIVYVRRELPFMVKGIQIRKIAIANVAAAIVLVLLKHKYATINSFLLMVITSVMFFASYILILIFLKEKFIYCYYQTYSKKMLKMIGRK